MSVPLVVPIVIRSLAGRYTFDGGDVLPIDSSILACLDAGQHQQVNSFALPWWSGRKPRDVNTVEIFSASTLRKCLDHHREQISISKNLPAGAGAGRILASEADGSGTTGAKGKQKVGAGTPISKNARSGCDRCANYRQLLSDVLQDVLKFQKYASGMSTSSENLLNIGIRRGSTFNLLHQAAILKETAGISPPAKAETAELILSVNRTASSELKRLLKLQPSSYKWTWGETLTEDEVLQLCRIGTRPGRTPHSGYDICLAEGKQAGEYSEYSEGLGESLIGQYEDLPADVIPSTDHHFPQHFQRPDPLIYNPFPISPNMPVQPRFSDAGEASFSSPVQASTQAPAQPPGSPSPFDLAKDWGSGSDSVPQPGSPSPFDLAKDWGSGSDSVPGSGSVAGSDSMGESGDRSERVLEQVMPVVTALANEWHDDDASDVFQLADQWNDEEDLVPESIYSVENEETDALSLANLWNAEEEVDELDEDLTTPSYACEVPAAISDPVLSDVYQIAEGCAAEELPDESQPQPEWSYGPQHFNFLNDDMFASENEENEDSDLENVS